MLLDRQHLRDSDSRGGAVRPHSGNSRIRLGGTGRDRSGRETLRRKRKAERLLRTDQHQDESGMRGSRQSGRWDRLNERKYKALVFSGILLLLAFVYARV